MAFRPSQSQDVEKETFGDAVLSHDRDRDVSALVGEFNDAFVSEAQQAVTFQARHGL